MTVISDYRRVPVLRDATFPDDVEAIVKDPANHRLEVVIGLTDVSDVIAFERPQEGLTVAKAAINLAGELTPGTPEYLMGFFRALSVGASRLRGVGKLDDADVSFMLAYNTLMQIPGEHFAERADHYRRLGYLHIDQRAYGAALEAANRSRQHFEFAGNKHGVGCALVCRGTVYLYLERFDHAEGDYNTALDLLDRDLGFNHVWAASINRALTLIDGAGDEDDIEGAIRQLQEVNTLRRYAAGTLPYLSVEWAEARLLTKLMQYAPAQAKLIDVCAGWRSLELPYELTVASLDLARCYFEQGLRDELVRLAGRMFPLFARFRHDEEAYGALRTFHRATLDGSLQAPQITETRAAVEVAQVA